MLLVVLSRLSGFVLFLRTVNRVWDEKRVKSNLIKSCSFVSSFEMRLVLVATRQARTK